MYNFIKMNLRLSRSIWSSIYRFGHDEIVYKKLQFHEFVDLWVPRNAKALKCIFLAGEGIQAYTGSVNLRNVAVVVLQKGEREARRIITN